MKNYLNFETEIKNLETELDNLKDPYNQSGLSEVDTKDKICGDYYRCCIPCSCDVMKYAKVKKMKHKFKDVEKEFYVLTIKNPCGKNDFPKRVNRDYFCDGKDLSKDQVVEIDNRLVIGLFYEGKLCAKSDIAKVDSHQVQVCFVNLEIIHR